MQIDKKAQEYRVKRAELYCQNHLNFDETDLDCEELHFRNGYVEGKKDLRGTVKAYKEIIAKLKDGINRMMNEETLSMEELKSLMEL